MATVTIEIDIDADGNPTVSPNPARVANGDVVKFHVNSNAHGGGRLKVTFPGSTDSPFGNPELDLAAEISGPERCLELSPNAAPARWPEGATRYRYRVAFEGSPLVSIEGVLENADIVAIDKRLTGWLDRFDRIDRRLGISLIAQLFADAKEPDPCREEIVTTISGEFKYATIDQNADCGSPSPSDKAEADSNARDNLRAYGVTWCGKGSCAPGQGQCKPRLSEIRNVSYATESRPAPEAKKNCFVVATISGKVSCRCE